jgi:plasmid stability protein
MELTIRDIPEEVDRALRARAAAEGKSIDQVALDALRAASLRFTEKKRDLSDIAGTWVHDPIFDEIRAEHERIDPDMWK